MTKAEKFLKLSEDKWIQKTDVAKNKGDLHAALGIPEDQKIPLDALQKAAKSKDPHIRGMAQFALNVRK